MWFSSGHCGPECLLGSHKHADLEWNGLDLEDGWLGCHLDEGGISSYCVYKLLIKPKQTTYHWFGNYSQHM